MSLGFRKFISEMFMNGKFSKTLPSENFPLYGNIRQSGLSSSYNVWDFPSLWKNSPNIMNWYIAISIIGLTVNNSFLALHVYYIAI